jgi:hypothetical protein
MMPILIGLVLALVVGAFATVTRLDRDRAFYPTVTIIVASYYLLFAVEGGAGTSLMLELIPFSLFLVAAVVGFRQSLWLVAAALVGHGLLDSVHGRLIADAGVPEWWPPFCGSYDVAAGLYLVVRLRAGAIPVRPGG